MPAQSQRTNYRMRRVGNIGNIPTFEPAVGLFLDGAYRNRPIFSTGDMFDIERIEVLRGPQSTLYGKNTTAGVVAIYTKSPADSFEGNASFDMGQVEGASDATLYCFLGGISGPLTDTLGAAEIPRHPGVRELAAGAAPDLGGR